MILVTTEDYDSLPDWLKKNLESVERAIKDELKIEKHLLGQHDQSTHAHRSSGAEHLSNEDAARLQKWRELKNKAKQGQDAIDLLEQDQPWKMEQEAKDDFLGAWSGGDYVSIQKYLAGDLDSPRGNNLDMTSYDDDDESDDNNDPYVSGWMRASEIIEKADYAYETNQPLSDNIVLHRAAGKLPFDPETAKAWDTFRVPVYTATSADPDLRWIRTSGLGGNNTISILAKKGSKSVLWSGEGGENEAVINRDAEFRILDIRKEGNAWSVELLLRG